MYKKPNSKIKKNYNTKLSSVIFSCFLMFSLSFSFASSLPILAQYEDDNGGWYSASTTPETEPTSSFGGEDDSWYSASNFEPESTTEPEQIPTTYLPDDNIQKEGNSYDPASWDSIPMNEYKQEYTDNPKEVPYTTVPIDTSYKQQELGDFNEQSQYKFDDGRILNPNETITNTNETIEQDEKTLTQGENPDTISNFAFVPNNDSPNYTQEPETTTKSVDIASVTPETDFQDYQASANVGFSSEFEKLLGKYSAEENKIPANLFKNRKPKKTNQSTRQPTKLTVPTESNNISTDRNPYYGVDLQTPLYTVEKQFNDGTNREQKQKMQQPITIGRNTQFSQPSLLINCFFQQQNDCTTPIISESDSINNTRYTGFQDGTVIGDMVGYKTNQNGCIQVNKIIPNEYLNTNNCSTVPNANQDSFYNDVRWLNKDEYNTVGQNKPANQPIQNTRPVNQPTQNQQKTVEINGRRVPYLTQEQRDKMKCDIYCAEKQLKAINKRTTG